MKINLIELFSITLEALNNISKTDKKLSSQKENSLINNSKSPKDIVLLKEDFFEHTSSIVAAQILKNYGKELENGTKQLINFLTDEIKSLKKNFTSKENTISEKVSSEIEKLFLESPKNNTVSSKNADLLFRFLNTALNNVGDKIYFDKINLSENKFLIYKAKKIKDLKETIHLSLLINTYHLGLVEIKLLYQNKNLYSYLIFENTACLDKAKKAIDLLKKERKMQKLPSNLKLKVKPDLFDNFFKEEIYLLDKKVLNQKV